MRIENITDENIIGLPNVTLHNLRIRFIDIFDKFFIDPAVRKAVDIDRQIFYEKYIILRAEMTARGMKFLWSSLLDKDISKCIFKSLMWDLDVPAMGEVAIVPEYVSVGGSFIKSPKDAEDIDIIIRDSEDNRDESFELKVGRLIREQTKKEPHFVYAPKGPHSSYIPLFDLVLRAREETKKVRVKESIVAKELTPAQRKECDEETERIKENSKKAEWPHKFKPAKYTHPNGHPRCLICGDEEEIGGICHKSEDLTKEETERELNLEDKDFRLTLIGTGAMDSPRKDESLLVSYKGHDVLIDAGKKIRAKDLPELDAILVCDDKSRYMNDAKRIGEAFDLVPEVGEFSADDLKIIPFPVKHTKHKTYGYRIEAQGKTVIYAPEFFIFPEKEIKDADLAILEGSAWKRPIVFTGKVGGHAAVLDSWEKAKKLGVSAIFTHIGKPVEAKLDEAKELGINIANDGDIIGLKEIEKTAISLGHAFTPLKSRGGYGKYEFADIETLWTTWAQGYIPEPGVAVETKIDGFRVQIHKKGITVKILSEDAKRDLAPKLEGLAEEIESIGPDCVLDGELTIWTDAGKVDRKDMPTYLAGKGGSYEGRIDVFDCLWYGKDLHSLPWTERQKYLDKIFAAVDEKLLKRLRPTITKTEDAFRAAIKKHSSEPHSEGAMCKVINSPYALKGETSEWAKYKHLKEVRCRVVGKKAKKGGGFIYTCELKGGIPIGRTYSTKIDVSVGDILEVAVAEVKYDEEEDKFTWDNPIVRSKKPAGTELTTKEQAKALARLKRTKKEEGREFGNITFEVGDKGKGVAQVHIMGLSEEEIEKLKKETTRVMIARGNIEKLEATLKGVIGDHGAHIDMRLRRGKENEWQGNEIFIGNISGLSKLSELKEGKRKLRAPWKQSRADEPKTETITGPLGWMEAGARKIDTFAPGTPGATANKWGAMIRIDSFNWEMYLADEHAKKFHLTGSKFFDGNWLFSYVPITEAGKKGPRIWMMSKLADDDHEKEETEKQRINSPTFAYKAVYGELPPEPLRGRTDSQKKTWRGLEVDEHLKDEWLEQLNSIERIEIRSTDEGKSEERVAFVVFRMKDSENDSQAEAISESLNEMENLYSLCDTGAEERPRIVVAGKVIYGQSGWEEWWNSLAEKIGKRVWMISKLKEEETQKDTMFKIVKIDKAKQIVGGVIYEPDEVDTQGDYTDIAEIEKAMHRFMEKYATNTNRIRINHKGKKYFFPILECFQPEADTIKGDQPLKKGSWWLMIKVTNKRIWKDIEEGKLRGFSMGGRAKA